MAALTACNWGLDCLQPQPRQPVLRRNKLRIFRFRASAKAQSLRLFLLSPRSRLLRGDPNHGRTLCVQTDWAAHGAFLARRKLASGSSRAVRVSQPAVLSALLAIQLSGIVIPPPFPLKSTKRSAAAISRSQRSFITFYGALWNILLSAGFPAMFHMIALEQTFVNGPLQKIFSY